MILYIAGPMTGLPDYNYPAFHEAEKRLREMGFDVLNPARNEAPELPTWENWLRLALAQVIQADGVALLRGWEKSKGAQLEVRVAQALGIETFSVDIWTQEFFHLVTPCRISIPVLFSISHTTSGHGREARQRASNPSTRVRLSLAALIEEKEMAQLQGGFGMGPQVNAQYADATDKPTETDRLLAHFRELNSVFDERVRRLEFAVNRLGGMPPTPDAPNKVSCDPHNFMSGAEMCLENFQAMLDRLGVVDSRLRELV